METLCVCLFQPQVLSSGFHDEKTTFVVVGLEVVKEVIFGKRDTPAFFNRLFEMCWPAFLFP